MRFVTFDSGQGPQAVCMEGVTDGPKPDVQALWRHEGRLRGDREQTRPCIIASPGAPAN